MNFFILTFDSPPQVGGVEARVLNYSINLKRMGHNVDVMMLSAYFKTFQCSGNWFAKFYKCPSSIRRIVKTYSLALELLLRDSVDVVFILTGAASLLGVLISLTARLMHKRTGIFIYGKDILTASRSPIPSSLVKISLILAQRVGVNSIATARLLTRSVQWKTRVLYPGVDTSILHKPQVHRRMEKEREILFVGRLVQRKGVDDLIRALKLLLEEVSDVKLIIVGDGPLRERLHSLVLQLKVEDSVIFLGEVRGEALYRIYEECDVFAMPSKSLKDDVEGFGIVFLEAGLFAKPSVGTWSGGIPEAIIDQETGILVDEGNILQLKDALKKLLLDDELAHRMGENAKRRVLAEFGWDKATNRLVELFT